MTKREADKLLIERFEQINEAAAQEDTDKMELCALADSAHKLYITLCNAGAFDQEDDSLSPSGLLS